MIQKFRLFLILWLSIPLNNFAQSSGKAYVINYTQADYKLGRQNWSVYSNKNSTTYFGNNDGILVFDGVNWQTIYLSEKKVVRSVYISSDKKLYIGAFEEFGYFENYESQNSKFINLSDSIEKKELHNNEIWRITEQNGQIYFQSFGSIYIFDGKKMTTLKGPSAFVLLMKLDNELYVHVVDSGLYKIQNNKLQFIPTTKQLAKDEIKTILKFGKDTLLLGAAKGGLFLLTKNKKLEYWDKQINKELKFSEINAGIKINNQFVIGTIVNGIYIFNKNGKITQHLSTDNYLNNNTILSLYDDKNGNFWATLDNGMAYIRTNDPLEFYLAPISSSHSVYSATFYDNKLWIGTNQGVFTYSKSTENVYSNPQLVNGTQGQVWNLQIFQNKIVCGHNNGTYILNKQSVQNISTVHGGFYAKELEIKNKKLLLQSTYNEFVVYEYKTNWVLKHKVKGFEEPIPSFSIDYLGNIWAAHLQKGVYQLKMNKNFDSIQSIRYFDKTKGLFHNRNIYVSQIDGRIAFLTQHKIYTYDDLKDSIIPYESINSKLGYYKEAQRCYKVGNSKYWLIANNRIVYFELKNKNFVKLFEYDLGRQNAYLTSTYPNISTLDSSRFLIGLDNGFAIYNQNKIQKKDSIKIILREITASDKSNTKIKIENWNQNIKIDYKYNSIKFKFSANKNIIAPWFRYRLLGFEKNWNKWTESTEVHFERLPAGNYTLQAEIIDIQENKSEPINIKFKILPPIYASNVAYAFYILISFILLFYFRKYFKYRIKKHALELHKKELEEQNKKHLLEEQKRIKQNNAMLLDEVSKQNMEMANYTLIISRFNTYLNTLKEEINRQKKELAYRIPKSNWKKLLSIISLMENKEDAWKTFELHFNRVNNQFIHRLKEEHPELTSSDLKLCVYLKLNLNTKEIAPLLNISVRGVEVRRYRLRKRLKLNSEDNLIEFLMQF